MFLKEIMRMGLPMSLGPTLHCKMMVVHEKARPKHAWKDQGEVWHKSKQEVLPYLGLQVPTPLSGLSCEYHPGLDVDTNLGVNQQSP